MILMNAVCVQVMGLMEYVIVMEIGQKNTVVAMDRCHNLNVGMMFLFVHLLIVIQSQVHLIIL